jgi:hypothetical protein
VKEFRNVPSRSEFNARAKKANEKPRRGVLPTYSEHNRIHQPPPSTPLSPDTSTKSKENSKDIYRAMHHESSPAPSEHGMDDDDTFDGDDHGGHQMSAHANALLSRISTADESDDISPKANPFTPRSQRSLSQRSFGQAAGGPMLSMSNEVSAIHANTSKSMNNTVEVQDFLSVDSLGSDGEQPSDQTQRRRLLSSNSSKRMEPTDETNIHTSVSSVAVSESQEGEIKPRIITTRQATIIGVNRVVDSDPVESRYPTRGIQNPSPDQSRGGGVSDPSSKWVVATKTGPTHADQQNERRDEEEVRRVPSHEDPSLRGGRDDWEAHESTKPKDGSARFQKSFLQSDDVSDGEEQRRNQEEDDLSVSTLHADEVMESGTKDFDHPGSSTSALQADQYIFPDESDDDMDPHTLPPTTYEGDRVRDSVRDKGFGEKSRSLHRDDFPTRGSPTMIDPQDRAHTSEQRRPSSHHDHEPSNTPSVPSLDLTRHHLPDTHIHDQEEHSHLQRISEDQKRSLLRIAELHSAEESRHILESAPDRSHAAHPTKTPMREMTSSRPTLPEGSSSTRNGGGGYEMEAMIQRIRILEAESRAKREQLQLDDEKYKLSETAWSGEIITLKVYIKDLEGKLQEERNRNRKLLSEVATRDAEIASLSGVLTRLSSSSSDPCLPLQPVWSQ